MAHILLVEDAHDLAELIARELRAANHDVITAADGRAALQLHAAHAPDLVILDWNLPEVDGLEVLRRLRQHAPTPVLMLTGRTEEIDRVVGLEVGADDYLVKPFSMRELLARTRAMLRRVELIRQQVRMSADEAPPPPRDPEAKVGGPGGGKAAASPSPLALHYADLVVDSAAYAATLNGVPLDLSRLEFDLLHLFVSHPGRVFTRDHLLDTVWGNAFDGQDRAVDYVIHRLRQKLAGLGEAIETVRGVGYRMRSPLPPAKPGKAGESGV
jgi:DNA-binding response OmpR family regulator